MPKRTSHKQASCSVARPLDAIGDWWSLLIIRDAFEGVRRFGEFQTSLGMSKNILASRLRNLIAHQILVTSPASDGSAYWEYVLTPKGKGLFPMLVALRQWGEDFFFSAGESHVVLVDAIIVPAARTRWGYGIATNSVAVKDRYAIAFCRFVT